MLLHALDLNPNLFSEIRALEAAATLISSTFKIGRKDSREGEEIERVLRGCMLLACLLAVAKANFGFFSVCHRGIEVIGKKGMVRLQP